MRQSRLLVAASAVLFAVPVGGAAQGSLPAGLADLELARSRACVPVLAQLDELNRRLEPLGLRTRRLSVVATAIAIEDRMFIDSLDTTDSTEAAVRDWFISDGRLAQSFIANARQETQQQRTVNREQIKGTVQAALEATQAQAEAIIEGAGVMATESNACDGAILIRSAIVEACETVTSALCTAARATEPEGTYRFVDTAQELWEVQEVRPWSPPGPVQVGPDGQLAGARTMSLTRNGNVVLSVAFSPLIRLRSEMAPEEVADFETILDSIGFEFDHPDIVYAPSISIRATLPDPLAGEDQYMIHFGEIEDADVLWMGPAGSGAPIEVPIVLQPVHIVRLQRGEPIRLTAIRSVEGGDDEPLYSLEVTTLGQSPATQALLGYMAGQMVEDLLRLMPPNGG